MSAPHSAPILRRRTTDLNATLALLIYRALQWAASPLLILYFLGRIVKNRRYLGRFYERLGFLPASFRQTTAGAIWLHAVSVGEVLSVVPLLRRLRSELPGAPVFVSASTLAGRALAAERLNGLADGVFYAPIDYCFAVRRVLRTLRPALVLIAETEIWPNLYREAKRAGCGLLLINGRISDAAFPRYLRFRAFFQAVLSLPDRILAQSALSRQRFLQLGAPPDRVLDAGNLKYDFQPGPSAIPAEIRQFLDQTAPEHVFIAASTMPPARPGDVDEDDAVLDAFAELAPQFPRLLLILVPRKPERFEAAAAKLAQRGIPFVRRTGLASGARLERLPGVLLLDSIGELASLFTLESVVFMGGSLADRGGHNLLEPAFYARPVIFGPHMENFAEIAEEFQKANACVAISRPGELAAAATQLLLNPAACRSLGQSARKIAEARRGATSRVLEAAADLWDSAIPHDRPPFPLFQLLWLLSQLWAAAAALGRRWNLARRRRLQTPVISAGNLTLGGSGKTPFVLWLVRRLREDGLQPGILIRGYRRRVPEKITLAEAGAPLPVARTGDEAQLLLRAALAPVAIGANRYLAGRALEQRFAPDILVLDDGFQHVRLARDLDIVLIDTLDPFGGGNLFPLGRLREPVEALRRAGLILLTRCEPHRSYRGLTTRLRQINPRAPILKARIVPEAWIDCRTGAALPLSPPPGAPLAAFCGLANPASFWRTLRGLGCRPLFQRSFGDHHSYRPMELRRLAQEAVRLGAAALVTTEKDAINLCEGACELAAPLRLYYLRIGITVDGEEELLRLVKETIHRARLKVQ